MLQLKDYKVFKEEVERKESVLDVIVKVMAASVEQTEKRVLLLQNENGLLQNAHEALLKSTKSKRQWWKGN